MLSNEQVFCAAAAAAVCGMRYWTLRNEELNKAKDVGTPFVSTKALSLKDMIVIGKKIQLTANLLFATYSLQNHVDTDNIS